MCRNHWVPAFLFLFFILFVSHSLVCSRYVGFWVWVCHDILTQSGLLRVADSRLKIFLIFYGLCFALINNIDRFQLFPSNAAEISIQWYCFFAFSFSKVLLTGTPGFSVRNGTRLIRHNQERQGGMNLSQVNPFTANNFAFLQLRFFQEQSRVKVKLSKNSAFENFVAFNNSWEARILAGGCTTSYKQTKITLPMTSYDGPKCRERDHWLVFLYLIAWLRFGIILAIRKQHRTTTHENSIFG